LEKLLAKYDMLIAISSSGNSSNIVNAAAKAMNKEVFTITLSGFSERNKLRQTGNVNIWIGVENYGIV
jgi:D-sedoheptulose 7-phosphate isomerase